MTPATDEGCAIATDRIENSPTFDELRAMAQNKNLRGMIEQRKDRICFQEWMITPVDSCGSRMEHMLDYRKRDSIEERLTDPDGLHPFSAWLRLLVEDLLVLDAMSVFIMRDELRQVKRLMPLDSAMILLLVDGSGEPAKLPAPFAVQVSVDKASKEPGALNYYLMTARDMVYGVKNRTHRPVYGYSAIEQIGSNEWENSQRVIPDPSAIFTVFEPLLGDTASDLRHIEKYLTRVIDQGWPNSGYEFRFKVDMDRMALDGV